MSSLLFAATSRAFHLGGVSMQPSEQEAVRYAQGQSVLMLYATFNVETDTPTRSGLRVRLSATLVRCGDENLIDASTTHRTPPHRRRSSFMLMYCSQDNCARFVPTNSSALAREASSSGLRSIACSNDARTFSALSAQGDAITSAPLLSLLEVAITSVGKVGATAFQITFGHGGAGSAHSDASSRAGTEEEPDRASSFASVRKPEICRQSVCARHLFAQYL